MEIGCRQELSFMEVNTVGDHDPCSLPLDSCVASPKWHVPCGARG
jgi:hypothetical protein